MSEPIDDKAFDEYLSRQSQLSKRYRALDADEVPPELDRRVLAQAHEALADKTGRAHKKPAWMRWSAPLALAASAVLVVSIVIQSGTQHELTPRAVHSLEREERLTSGSAAANQDLSKQDAASPAPQSTPAPQAPQLPKPEAVDDSVTVAAPPASAREKVAASSPSPSSVGGVTNEAVVVTVVPVVAPPPQLILQLPADASPTAAISTVNAAVERSAAAEKRADSDGAYDESGDLAEVAVTGMRRQRRVAGQGAGPRGTVPPVAAADHEESDAAFAQMERESDAQSWLEYIRQLRKDGKSRQADREWKRFRAAHPSYPVDAKDAAQAPK